MSAISFPQNPNIGEIFTNPNTGSQFQWTGSSWNSYAAPLGVSATGPAGTSGTSGFDGVTGPQGIQGEVGPVGPAGLNWRGMWAATTTYSEDDSVGYTGASWFNILGITGNASNLPPDQDTTHWALLASQGSQGQQGPQGLAGTNGTSGSSGSSGSSGLSGVNGTSGTSGVSVTGATGFSGSSGSSGTSGTSGARGTTGATGSNGSTGATGPISYSIPDTFTTATWVFLGTWNTAQGGHTLRMSISAHAGYNAQTTQNQSTEVYLVTSNGSSANASGVGGSFYASGSASRDANLGSSSFAPSLIRVVQSNSGTYLVYGYFGTFSANSHYTLSTSPGTSWSPSGTIFSGTPTGTYLDITPTQLGGLSYANFTFNAFPTVVGDFTPIIGNASGITVSGTTITLANAGIYLLQANLTVRSSFAVYEWMTLSNTRVAGTVPGVSVSANSTDSATPAPAAGILNAAAGSQIKLRLTNQSGAINTFQEYASAQIIQLR